MPPEHHEPFRALAPIEWSGVPPEDKPSLLEETFASAQTLVDSIPLPAPVAQEMARSSGRARSHTESAVALSGEVAANRALAGYPPGRGGGGGDSERSEAARRTAQQLREEWKEVKIGNPLGICVYKLAAKDGRGSWFARRSVHEGVSFDTFRLGLEREFAETLRKGHSGVAPAQGNIRSIGAERRVERESFDGVGSLEVYHLSARFPGPATARDFVTMLLSTSQETQGTDGTPGARQFMIVSKPCVHPQCSQRQGFVRGQYESVEVIRQIPIGRPLRRVRSSIDVNKEPDIVGLRREGLGRDAILRSATKSAAAAAAVAADDSHASAGGRLRVSSTASTKSDIGPLEYEADESEMAVEWLMVTRSDPGGNVPRFMVDRGTPGGITSDAEKLIRWLESKEPGDFITQEEEYQEALDEAPVLSGIGDAGAAQQSQGETAAPTGLGTDQETPRYRVSDGPPGFYGMIAGALGAAGSAVATRLPYPFSDSSGVNLLAAKGSNLGSAASDSSSVGSFTSAQEPEDTTQEEASPESLLEVDVSSTHSSKSGASKLQSQHEKELQKLQERRRKVQEKVAREQERAVARQGQDRDKETAAAAKLREKHDRELARQEEKFAREVRRLEERRLKEERQAEDKRRKAAEREEKADLSLALERTSAERDVALKEIEVLKDRIGDLQAQNTMLVAHLGRSGVSSREDLNDLNRGSTLGGKDLGAAL